MSRKSNPRSVSLWLFICCAMVFVMALLGAITRLTESGLSITDWSPVKGALPPLNDIAWDEAFTAYKQIPQYQVLHHGMTLQEFKGIYFWEWLHRLWGRLIGLVFAVPFIWFLIRKQIDKKTGWYLGAIFALGGVQGFIGWFMVESGLSVRTSVSPYRLALHLGFALLIYALMLWPALGMRRESAKKVQVSKSVWIQGWIALGFLAVTMVWGAFTAGLHAGEAYNTWPLMEGEFFPAAATTLQPVWINMFENLAFVQFIHRWLGPTTMIVLLAWVGRRWKGADRASKRWLHTLGGMAFLQVMLGLGTLMMHAETGIATLHQAGAITLLTLLLINLERLRAKA